MASAEDSLVLVFSIPLLKSDQLPRDQAELHRLFVEAISKADFPKDFDKVSLLVRMDPKRTFLPELDKLFFHLSSAGFIEAKSEGKKTSYFVSPTAKKRLGRLADDSIKRGRVTREHLSAARALAEKIDSLLPSYLGSPAHV